MDRTYIGTFENGKFRVLAQGPALSGNFTLTTISMQGARPPETGELNLKEHEGNAIAVHGHDGEGWIYKR